jgi:plastocyanin
MRALILLTPVAALLLSAPPAAAAPRNHVVTIDKMKFGPVPAGIRAGDRVTWVNRDVFRHTATDVKGSFEVDLPPGTSKAVVIRRAGAISVTCRYHPGMRAMLKVAAR